jgi:O-antigen ligase
MPDPRLRMLRPILWLAGLLVVALVAQSAVVVHQARLRGIPSGFPAPVAGADVPILGVNVALEQYDDEALSAALARVAEGGFTWIRQSFYWSLIEPEPGRHDWSTPDRIMAALARYPQLRLVVVLDDSPPVPPADPARFAAFAREFATRYGAQVDDYQVWDEPNLAAHWGGGPINPPAYADLLARTARAIRTADRSAALPPPLLRAGTAGPDARIILAGLAPTVETGPQNLSDVRYLEQLYQAGAAPYFDVVAGKPYGFDTGPDDRRADEAVLNFSRLLLLREVMVKHGDAGKAIWASHWGWNALPGPSTGSGQAPSTGSGQGWAGALSSWGQTDEATQAVRTVAALERARTEWPWVGALILEHFQPAVSLDDPHWGFALVGQDGAPRPVYDAVVGWATALPDAASVGGYPAHNLWATYEGDWHVGPLGADVGSDGDRATFRFNGTSIALTARRGPYRAFLYVTVDGTAANSLPRDETGRTYIVLYDSAPVVVTVPLATGLSPGLHTVEVVAEGGQGQWVLVDWRVGVESVHDGYGWKVTGLVTAGLVLAALLACDARQVEWGALGRRFLGWPEWAQTVLVVGLTGLLWATAGVSWGRGLFSTPYSILHTSCFVLSLLTLPVLTAIFVLRPDLGLALVALTAPFYLHPGSMFYRALSLAEVLVVLCWVGRIANLRIYKSTNRQIGKGSRRLHANRRISSLDLAVMLLVLAAVVAGLVAADWRAALFELRTIFLLPALYYVLLRLASLDNRAKWRIMDGFVLGAVGVAAIGLWQYALGRNVVVAEGGLPRLQSVYYSPNNVGLYLGRVWPLVVAIASWGEQGHRRMLYRLALGPVTLALVLSFSRGALLLGLPAALLAMGWCAGDSSNTSRRYRWAALALVVIGVLALVPLLRVPRFASLFDLRQGSTFFRLELWRSSLALIREHPWFGVGPGNFLDAYRTRYVLPFAWQEFNLEHPHNVYLDHWTRLGLLGLLAGVVIQVTFFKSVNQRVSESANQHALRIGGAGVSLALGLMGSMAAFLAHGLVDNTLFFPDLALGFFLTLGLVQWSETSNHEEEL